MIKVFNKLRSERLSEFQIVERKQNFAQVNTPPPHAVSAQISELPVPTGIMRVCVIELGKMDGNKKEIKRENVSKAVPTGLKREREEGTK